MATKVKGEFEIYLDKSTPWSIIEDLLRIRKYLGEDESAYLKRVNKLQSKKFEEIKNLTKMKISLFPYLDTVAVGGTVRRLSLIQYMLVMHPLKYKKSKDKEKYIEDTNIPISFCTLRGAKKALKEKHYAIIEVKVELECEYKEYHKDLEKLIEYFKPYLFKYGTDTSKPVGKITTENGELLNYLYV